MSVPSEKVFFTLFGGRDKQACHCKKLEQCCNMSTKSWEWQTTDWHPTDQILGCHM